VSPNPATCWTYLSRRGVLRAGLFSIGGVTALAGCGSDDGSTPTSSATGERTGHSPGESDTGSATATDESTTPTDGSGAAPATDPPTTTTDPYPDALTIPYGAPAIDGTVDEYGEPLLTLQDDFYDYEPDPPEQSQGEIWLWWDERRLTIAASIVDDEWHAAANSGAKIYENDCIEIGIWPGDPGPDDQFDEVQFGLGTEGVQVHRLTVPGDRNSEMISTAETALSRVGERTVFELGFPWSAFTFDVDPGPGDEFGLGIGHHDRDSDGSGGWQEWGGAPFVPKTPGEMAEARLGPRA